MGAATILGERSGARTGGGPRCGPSPIYKSYLTAICRVWSGTMRRLQFATDCTVLPSQELLSQRVLGEVQQALHAPQAPDVEQAGHDPQSREALQALHEPQSQEAQPVAHELQPRAV